MGVDFLPCKQGYSKHVTRDDNGRNSEATCINTDKSCEKRHGRDDDIDRTACNDYKAVRKRYIDIRVDGETYPRYWW